jgi:hypothetical protein
LSVYKCSDFAIHQGLSEYVPRNFHRYQPQLTLEKLSSKGKSGACKVCRARVLLLAGEERTDEETVAFLSAAMITVKS